jgi:hypothetical protein
VFQYRRTPADVSLLRLDILTSFPFSAPFAWDTSTRLVTTKSCDSTYFIIAKSSTNPDMARQFTQGARTVDQE